jgi:hypothetical protein
VCCALAIVVVGAAPAAAADPGTRAQAAKPKGKGGKGKGKGGRKGKELGQLKRAGCTPYRAIQQRKHTTAVRRAARRWKFEVFHFKTRLKPPVKWDTLDPYKSRSFRQNLHGLTWIDTLLYAYKRTGDRESLRRALDLALDWVKSNPRRFRPGRQGFAWHPKAAADRAGYLGFVARTAACEGLLNAKQARLLMRSLKAHGRYLASDSQHQASNFGLFQDLGLLILSKYLSFKKESTKWRKTAVRRFPETLRGRLSSENVWLEHSSQYQFLAVRLLRDFIKYRPGKKRDPGLSDTLAEMRAATGWFVKPDRSYALLGDTEIAGAPEWGYNVDATYDGLGAFDESGFAFVRRRGSYLATTSSFFNTTHKHADELDFDLFDRGRRIVHGPGNYGYDRSAAFRTYQLSSQAHSVLIADGQSFPIQPPFHGSGIRATGQGAGWFAIDGVNPLLAPQGVAHSRLFLYRPGQVLVVVDRVRANRLHRYQRFFQLGPDIQIQGRGPGELGLSAEGFRGALQDSAAAGGSATRTLVRGRYEPLQGLAFPGFRQAVPRWSVEYSSLAEDADYVTVFTLDGATLRGQLEPAGGNQTRVTLSRGSSSQTLSVTRSGRRLSVAVLP